MIIYSVSRAISDKWIYDLIISIKSVLRYNPDECFTVYYDVARTKEQLQDYLQGADIDYIKDSFSVNFSTRLGSPNCYLGTGVYNIFQAMSDFSDFYFFDTDVFCYDKISCTHDNAIGVIPTVEYYSRCISHITKVNDVAERLANLPEIRKGDLFADEIILKENFGDLLAPLKIKGVGHFGNSPQFQKYKYADMELFNQLLVKIENNEKIPAAQYIHYIRGVDNNDSVL